MVEFGGKMGKIWGKMEEFGGTSGKWGTLGGKKRGNLGKMWEKRENWGKSGKMGEVLGKG